MERRSDEDVVESAIEYEVRTRHWFDAHVVRLGKVGASHFHQVALPSSISTVA